jgi:hypothetical protein
MLQRRASLQFETSQLYLVIEARLLGVNASLLQVSLFGTTVPSDLLLV